MTALSWFQEDGTFPVFYGCIISGSTNVWLLEPDPLEDVSVQAITIRPRYGMADFSAWARALAGRTLTYPQPLASEILTTRIKRSRPWQEAGESTKISSDFEQLSENFWIYVGEVRNKFTEAVRGDAHVYTLSDGAFVLDAILDGGRAACILRRRYAHLMLLTNNTMVDKVLQGDDATPERIESELRAVLA